MGKGKIVTVYGLIVNFFYEGTKSFQLSYRVTCTLVNDTVKSGTRKNSVPGRGLGVR